jgi:hypothetical protein
VLDVTLTWDHGVLRVDAVRVQVLERPVRLPAWQGRFRLTLPQGAETVAEQLFDLPLLAETESDALPIEAQRLGQQLRSGVTRSTGSVRLIVPSVEALRRVDSLVVYDRLTRRTVRLPFTLTR